MVGLSDIPCFGKVVERISDAVVDKLFHGLQYMFCYNNLVNVLNSEIGKLTIQETSMSRKADAEKANGKIIKDHVLKWQNDVMEIQESAKEFSEKYKNRHSWRCIRCMPIPNPVTRFRLGREAVQTAKTVTEFTNSGKELLDSEIAELPSFKNLPITDTEFQNFETRNDAYRKLWDQLETEGSFPILGIYGMPGVGKTRMMEQIWKEAIEKKIIKKVIRADVGNEDLNDKQVIIKLQQKIAGYLDCHFKSEDIVEHRASQLKDSLINSLEDGGKKLAGKILVIFDDVWSEIPLNKIGITSDDGSISKGCKILFTSLEENVCKKNKCQHPVEITTLEDVEAWNLFRNTVGTSTIDSLQDESLAKELCKPGTSFSKLIFLKITDCSAIKYLFCNSVAKCLGQLEKLYIENCFWLEVIIMNEGIGDGDIITFSKLKTLKLYGLPKLTSFYGEQKDIHSSSTSIMDNSDILSVQFQPLFDGKVLFRRTEVWSTLIAIGLCRDNLLMFSPGRTFTRTQHSKWDEIILQE